MKKIAVYSKKGGTGKTTTVFNLAGVFAKRGLKVLCVDTDDQSNLSRRLLQSNIEESGLEWFKGRMTFEDLFTLPKEVNSAIYPAMIPLRGKQPKRRGIDIIPVKPSEISPPIDLNRIDYMIEEKRVEHGQIRTAFDNIRRTRTHLYEYDYCLVDFSPAFNNVSVESLSACDYLIIPSSVDVNSMDGISQILDIINGIKSGMNPDLELLGIFFTMSNHVTSYDRQMEDQIRESLGEHFFRTAIRYNSEIKWSLHSGIPLCWNKRSAKVTQDYEDLADEIVERIG